MVVAGGSRGIGRAIALGFAAAGARVSVCARGAQALEDTRAALEELCPGAHAGVCDLSDGPAVGRYVAQAEQALGARFQIRSIPTLVKLDHGRELGRRSGALPAGQIVAFAG